VTLDFIPPHAELGSSVFSHQVARRPLKRIALSVSSNLEFVHSLLVLTRRSRSVFFKMLRSAVSLRYSTSRRTAYQQHCFKTARIISTTANTVKPQTHSIVSGSLDPPLVELTLPAYYKEHILAKHDSRPALISRHEPNVRWNFAEFDLQIERMARGLLAAGVKPGDRVATILGSCR
jgi:hypothetical protein